MRGETLGQRRPDGSYGTRKCPINSAAGTDGNGGIVGGVVEPAASIQINPSTDRWTMDAAISSARWAGWWSASIAKCVIHDFRNDASPAAA